MKAMKQTQYQYHMSKYTLEEYSSDVVVWFVCVCVYWSTMLHTVPGGDGGELAVSACTLSVAHPPGYPTYTVLYHAILRVATILGPSSLKPALIFNAFSALLSSIAILLLHKSIKRITQDAPIALCTSLAFAFSPTVWLYSSQAEVFALHNLFMASLLSLTIWFFEYPCPRRLIVCAFVSSLSITNQHTSLLFILPVLIVIAINVPTILFTTRSMIQCIVALLLGASPYIWLIAASSMRISESWGDLTSWQGFLTHILRREYGTFQLGASDDDILVSVWQRLYIYFTELASESLYIFSVPAIIGIISLSQSSHISQRQTMFALLSSYICYLTIFYSLANLGLTPLLKGVTARFAQQPNLIVYFFAGIGLSVISRFNNIIGLFKASNHTMNITNITHNNGLWRYVIISLIFTSLSTQIWRQYYIRDLSTSDEVSRYGRAILDSMPDNALVLVNGDLNNNAPKYAHMCEKIRVDIRIINVQLMSWPWFIRNQAHHLEGVVFPGQVYNPYRHDGYTMRQFIASNINQFPIYFCGPDKQGDTSLNGVYQRWSSGICHRILPSGETPDNLTQWYKNVIRNFPSLKQKNQQRFSPDMWEWIVHNDIFVLQQHIFIDISVRASNNASDSAFLEVAAHLAKRLVLPSHLHHRELVKGEAIKPHNIRSMQPDLIRNAGIILGMYSVVKPIYAEYMIEAWRQYLISRPDDEQIRLTVEHRVNPYRGNKRIL